MNAMFAICAMIMAAAAVPVSPTTDEPATPARDNSRIQSASPQRAQPQPMETRVARTRNDGARRLSAMPLPPTDPRVYTRGDLPLPPTMNDAGMLPNTGRMATAPRFNLTESAESDGRRIASQKPFGPYRPASGGGVSPYALLDAPSNNGTIDTYTAYVRPALDQQRSSQESDGAANSEGPANAPPPSYPPVFQNYGSYYPNYGGGR